MLKVTEERIAELKRQHPELHLVEISRVDADLIVVAATPEQFRSFLEASGSKQDAYEALAQACLVFPSAEDYDELLDAHPGVGVTVGAHLEELAGLSERVKVTPRGGQHVIEIAPVDEEIVAESPTRAQFRRFLDSSGSREEAYTAFARDCVVEPADFAGLLGRYPGAGITVGRQLEEIAGLNERSRVKKL